MRRLLAFTLLLAAAALGADPSFDVASLKPSPPPPSDRININLGATHNGTLTLTNATLADCINFAYGLVSYDQLAGPDWVKRKDVRFDVIGKAAPQTSREQLLLMLRTLLTERFHLVMHTEPRKFTHLALVIGKGGSKLHEAQPDSPSMNINGFGHIERSQISMQTLALLLSRWMRQLVLDDTGLKGYYSLKLEWTPEPAADAGSGPSIYTAVQEQLGLKLESRKDDVDVLVIDHADRTPVAN